MKTEIIVVPLLLGLLSLAYYSWTADGLATSIIQNMSITNENHSQLVPWIGISEMENDLFQMGIFVNEISPDSPAAVAGISYGDKIIKADNKTVENTNDLEHIVTNKEIGQNLTLTLLNDDQEKEISLIVGSRPAPKYEEATKYSDPDSVNFSEYVDTLRSQYITMQYPTSWNFTKEDEYLQLTYSDSIEVSSLKFTALLENSKDLTREYLKLYVFPNPQRTLDELISVETPLSNLNKTKQQYNSTIGDNHARELEYTYLHDRYGEIKAMKVATQIENTTYLIAYQAQASKFDTYWPTIKRMIDSFETSELINYENFDIGMRVKYPSNWNKTEKLGYIGETYEDSPSVLFYPTPQNTTKQLSNVIRIYSYSSPTIDQPLEEEVDKIISDHATFDYPAFELREDPINVTISSLPFIMLNYSYSDSLGNENHAIEYITKSNDKLYFISYSAEEEDFLAYLSSLSVIIHSFETFKLLKYENFDIGIGIQYPSDWKKTEDENEPIINLYPINNDISIWAQISSRETDVSLLEEVNQTVSDYPPFYNVTGSNYTDSFPQFESPFMLNYSYSDPILGLRNNIEILTIWDGRLYSFLFSSPEKEYLQYLPSINRIVDSAEIYNVRAYEKIFGNNNYSAGFRLELPEGYPWDFNEVSNDTTDLMSESEGLISDLRLSVVPYNGNITVLDKLIIDGFNNKSDVDHSDILPALIPTTLENNVTAHKVNVSYYDDSTYIRGIQLYAVYNKNAYIFNYTAEEFFFADDLPTVQAIIDSAKILEQPRYDRYDEGNALLFTFKFPNEWRLDLLGTSFEIRPKNENETSFSVNEGLAGDTNLEDIVGQTINDYKGAEDIAGFDIILSNETKLFDNLAYQTISTYRANLCNCYMKEMILYTIINNKIYYMVFSTELSKFSSYSPIITDIINSMNTTSKGIFDYYSVKKSGLPLNGSPVDVAVNPVTDKLYVAVPTHKAVYVLDINNYRMVATIPTKGIPNTIAVNSLTNKIYVTSLQTDLVYIIDGLTNKFQEIQAEPFVGDIAFDVNPGNPFASLVFVSNGDNNTISVIDDFTAKIVTNISTGIGPYSIGVDPIIKKLYVTTVEGISVIDYRVDERGIFKGNLIDTIPVDNPRGVAVDSKGGRVYVTSPSKDIVSVIDVGLNEVVDEIHLASSPNAIGINSATKKIFTANSDNSLSIINYTDPRKSIQKIAVDSAPYGITIDPETQMIYSASRSANTISIVNSASHKIIEGVNFKVYPSNSGHITCKYNEKYDEITTNQFINVEYGTKCIAEPNSGYQFSSWTENLGKNSSKTLSSAIRNDSWFSPLINALSVILNENDAVGTFKVDQFGNFTAQFEKLDPPIPPEFWIPLYGIIVSSIVGWSIPSIVAWINLKRQLKRLHSTTSISLLYIGMAN